MGQTSVICLPLDRAFKKKIGARGRYKASLPGWDLGQVTNLLVDLSFIAISLALPKLMICVRPLAPRKHSKMAAMLSI